jgi:hypothetical protein
MLRRPISVLTPLAALSLAACASGMSGATPSLEKRAIEDRFAVVETAPPPAPGPLPTDLAGRLAEWRARAARADRAFAAALAPTEAAVAAARGAAVATESWITAQQALSRLAVARGPVGDALADVDALYLARQRDDSYDGLPEIATLRGELAALAAAQDERLAALAARLAE